MCIVNLLLNRINANTPNLLKKKNALHIKHFKSAYSKTNIFKVKKKSLPAESKYKNVTSLKKTPKKK